VLEELKMKPGPLYRPVASSLAHRGHLHTIPSETSDVLQDIITGAKSENIITGIGTIYLTHTFDTIILWIT
jgi:hypothetical protein